MWKRYLYAGGMVAGALGLSPAHAACTTTLGSVMSLTGSLGVLGQQIAKGAQLAVADLNAAGGNMCTLNLAFLDDQPNTSVGVDAPKKLVEVQNVQAIVDALATVFSAAILSSLQRPGKGGLISPSSTYQTLAPLSKARKTGGLRF